MTAPADVVAAGEYSASDARRVPVRSFCGQTFRSIRRSTAADWARQRRESGKLAPFAALRAPCVPRQWAFVVLSSGREAMFHRTELRGDAATLARVFNARTTNLVRLYDERSGR